MTMEPSSGEEGLAAGLHQQAVGFRQRSELRVSTSGGTVRRTIVRLEALGDCVRKVT